MIHLRLSAPLTAACLFLSFTFTPRVQAQSAPPVPDADATLTPEQVITATRYPDATEQTGTSVSVLTGEEIGTRQTLDIADLLATLPGVAVARDGGPGQVSSLYIRGSQPGESLVLLDGVRINDPSAPDGAAVLGDLLVSDLNRIEVLRGPESTLYGSDAIGGVVNILTRRGGDHAFEATVKAEGGTYDTARVLAAADGTVGSVEYGSGVNYYTTRGISAADARNGNTEPDGYRNLGANGSVRWHALSWLSVDLRGLYSGARADVDGYPPPDYGFEDTPQYNRDWLRTGYAGLNLGNANGTMTERLAYIASDSHRIDYGNWDLNTYAYAQTPNFYADGGASRWEYQAVVRPAPTVSLTYGAETELTTLSTEYTGDAAPTTGRDRRTGYYLQGQDLVASGLTLIGGLRYERDDTYGSHTSYKLAAAWQAGAATVLRANLGTGFKDPTLYQVYSPYSNPNAPLQPETSRGWEAGFDEFFLQKAVQWSETVFARGEQNTIDFNDCYPVFGPGCDVRPSGYYYNIGRTYARGVESALTAHVTDVFSAYANYTNETVRDELTGAPIARRPHVAANAGITWLPHAGDSLGLSVGYVGQRPDVDGAGNAGPVDRSARLFTLFGSYALSGHWQLYARIENLMNTYREPTYGYGALQRQLYAGIRATL